MSFVIFAALALTISATVGWFWGLTTLAATLAIVNALFYGAAVWGFRASRHKVGEATWWFVMGFCIVAGAIILRGMYWDVLMPLAREYIPLKTESWSDFTQGRIINNVFSSMKLCGIYCVLKCRQMLIPEEERHRWPVWKAWMHPNTLSLFRWWGR